MDEKASIELKRLLQNTRKMILPLKQNPSAPAQGALAIEVNSASVETLAMVQKLHDPETLRNVTEERKILAEWGGGCHLKLGASVLADHSLVIRGVTPNGESVSEVRNAKSAVKEFVKIEAQELFDFIPATLSPEAELLLSHSTTLFVAHPRAYEHLTHKAPIHTDYGKRVWVSGMKSWLSLAQNGVWVEGCLEGAGFKKMKEFQSKKLLSFVGPVLFISHSEAHQDSGAMIATYTHQFREIPEKIKTETSLFWSSGLLFRTAWNKLGKDFMLSKKHASGPGKTAETLSELLTPHGVKPDVFTLES
jgi:hydroxymethylbilane synthase